jgi:hypothetical protein
MKVFVDGQPVDLADLDGLPVPQPIEKRVTEETRTMENDPEIQITRLRLNHFRGWDQVDVDVGPGGAIFKGEEATGKTSFLLGIRAVTEAEGIGPEALRFDAAKGEVLLDMVKIEQGKNTAMQAKRTIKREGKGFLELLGSDGVPIPRPADQIGAMFGERSLNPLKVYEVMGDAKRLRQLIMSANPVTVTADDLNKWCETAQEWNVEGHGQEVLTRVREMYEGKRKTAGQEFEKTKASVALKTTAAYAVRVDKPEPMSPAAARTHVAAAERDLAVLRERRTQIAQREAASIGTRERVAELRAKAEQLMGKPEAVAPSHLDYQEARGEHQAASLALEEAQKRMDAAQAVCDAIDASAAAAHEIEAQATAAINQANELEQSILGQALDDPQTLAEQITAAEGSLEASAALVEAAVKSEKWRAAKADLVVVESAHKVNEEEWDRLDRIVKRLVKEAPSELASRADMIEGLELTPTSVLLDGKDITVLCGAERLRFAVVLTKRMAGRAKILTVDGMEAIPPGKQPEFVRMCLEGGWLLFATVVEDGPLVIVDAFTFAHPAGAK